MSNIDKGVADYMLIFKPDHITFNCPYCDNYCVSISYYDIYNKDDNDPYEYVNCPKCGEQIKLGERYDCI